MAWNDPSDNKPRDPWGDGSQKGQDKPEQGDPWGQRKPPRRPKGGNDFDAIAQKLQKTVSQLFGNKNSGNPNSNPKAHWQSILILPFLLLMVLLIVWVVTGFYLVDQSQRGVVLRFGKYYETVTPGLHWNPPLVDKVQLVNVTAVRSFEQNASMLTRDTNIVTVRISVQYQVSNPRDFVLNVQNPEQSLRNALDSTLRHVVGSSGMQNVLTSTSEVKEVQDVSDANSLSSMDAQNLDKAPVITMTPLVNNSLLSGREELGPIVAERLQQALDFYKVGLRLQTVNLESTQAPDQVQEAVDDVIRSREDRQRLINEARAYENALRPQTQGEAQRMIEEAEGYRDAVVADARGQASRFLAMLAEYKKAPQVTRERLYLDTLSEIYEHNPKAFIDLNENQRSLIYLPLDKLSTKGNSGAAHQNNPLLNSEALQSVERIIEPSMAGSEAQNSGVVQRRGRP